VVVQCGMRMPLRGLIQERKIYVTGGNPLTKEEVVKLLVLIESVYPNCICKDETVQQWFQFCSEMDYEKVLMKLKNHIRKSPFPPSIGDIAAFHFEENHFAAMLQEWIKKGCERIECDCTSNIQESLPAWLAEYSLRKTV
jgi:organic radical activating enzyme